MTHPSAADTRRHLAELPELCALLPDAAVTRSVVEGPRPAPASKPPLRLDVLDLMDTRLKADQTHHRSKTLCDPDRMGVLPYLFTWCRDLTETVEGLPPLPDRLTVATICDWLGQQSGIAETLPQFGEMAYGIKQTHQAVRDATTSVRDIDPVPVPCSNCGAGTLKTTGPNLWQCNACGREVTVQAVTIPQAAKIIGVKRSTLYAYRDRNVMQRIQGPGGPGGSQLFDLGSVRRMVAEERMRGITGKTRAAKSDV